MGIGVERGVFRVGLWHKSLAPCRQVACRYLLQAGEHRVTCLGERTWGLVGCYERGGGPFPRSSNHVTIAPWQRHCLGAGVVLPTCVELPPTSAYWTDGHGSPRPRHVGIKLVTVDTT